MGNDAYVHIDKKNHSVKSIENLLFMLDFEKRNDFYYFGNDEEYKYFSGVCVWKCDENTDELIYRVRTQIFASGYDIKKQNDTIRAFKKYCNAWFVGDMGKNRYFKVEKLVKGAESGCCFAIKKLDNNFSLLLYSLSKYPLDNEGEIQMSSWGIPTPSVFNANVYLAYLCSLMEDFFRSTYVALLKYSENKEKIIKNVKLSPFDLIDISNGNKSLEEALARTLSFQNIEKINSNFMAIDKKYDLGRVLKKPYKNRKESLYEQINRLFECRHAMIHKTEINIDYGTESLKKDITDIKVAFKRAYEFICEQNGWIPENIII